tara:strand:- start:30 stop:428 length:399 start_codon:yes stop_codon:yes gene_type:complete
MNKNLKKKRFSSDKSFGFLFFFIFLIIAFWSFRGNIEQIKFLPLFFSLIFLVLSLLNSKILTPLNKAWIKFGYILGSIISPIIMAAIFFLVITPVSLLTRLFGKDTLKIKNSKKDSYWIKRNNDIGPMNRQF